MSQMNGIASSQQLPAAMSGPGRTERTDGGISSAGTQVARLATDTDQTNVSTTAHTVAQALAGSDVRMARVTTLQGAIAAGTYNVSSVDAAAKLLSALMN